MNTTKVEDTQEAVALPRPCSAVIATDDEIARAIAAAAMMPDDPKRLARIQARLSNPRCQCVSQHVAVWPDGVVTCYSCGGTWKAAPNVQAHTQKGQARPINEAKDI